MDLRPDLGQALTLGHDLNHRLLRHLLLNDLRLQVAPQLGVDPLLLLLRHLPLGRQQHHLICLFR